MSRATSQSQSQSQTQTNWYEGWLTSTPVYTRMFTAATISLFFVSCVSDETFCQTVPYKVIYGLQLFRLFLSPFCEGSFMSLILSVLWLNKLGKDLEVSFPNKHMFALLLFKFAVASNALFVFASYTLAFNAGEILSHNLLNAGTQGLLGTMITFVLVHPPTSIPSIPIFPFFLLNGVNPKYLPWIVIGFVAIMNNTVPLDLLSSVTIGYAEIYGILGAKNSWVSRFCDRIQTIIKARFGSEWTLVAQQDLEGSHGSEIGKKVQ